jgi:hypothetical protein
MIDDFEFKVQQLIDKLNSDPATWQRGHFRVRIQGPWQFTGSTTRWLLAVEPYNDHDLVEGMGATLIEALEDANKKVDEVIAGTREVQSVYPKFDTTRKGVI